MWRALSPPLWLRLRIPLGNLCNRFWGGKPSSPSGTLGSSGTGSRSLVARLRLPHLADPSHTVTPSCLLFPSAVLLSLLHLASTGVVALLVHSLHSFHPRLDVYLIPFHTALAYSFSSPTPPLLMRLCSLTDFSLDASV